MDLCFLFTYCPPPWGLLCFLCLEMAVIFSDSMSGLESHITAQGGVDTGSVCSEISILQTALGDGKGT